MEDCINVQTKEGGELAEKRAVINQTHNSLTK